MPARLWRDTDNMTHKNTKTKKHENTYFVMCLFLCVGLLFWQLPVQAQTGGTCTCNVTIATALCTAASIPSQTESFSVPGQIVPQNFANSLANCTLPGSQPTVSRLQAIIEAFNATPIQVTDAATCAQAGRSETVNVGVNPAVTLAFTCAFESATGAQSGNASARASGVTVVPLRNPLGEGRTDLGAIVGEAIQRALTVLGSVTLLVFIAGGVMWLTSGGSEEKVMKGSKTMLYAVIGIAVIFAAYAILNTVIKTLTGT